MRKFFFIAWLILISNVSLADSNDKDVVWSKDKAALAFCNSKNTTRCFVVCNNKAVDVSAVERANLGKLGINNKYEKVVTYPSQWEYNNKQDCMFWFKTDAFGDGRRYTVKEPVYVADGRYDGR